MDTPPVEMTEHQRMAEVADLLAMAFDRLRRAPVAASMDARERPGTLGERVESLEAVGAGGPDGNAG